MSVRMSTGPTLAALLASACGPGSGQPATSGVSSTVPVATSPGESEEPAATAAIEDEYDWKPSVDPIYSVAVISDIVNGQGEVRGGGTLDDLLLDLYVPDVEGQDRFPLVDTVHRGGFSGGSKANAAFVSDQFAQRATSWPRSATGSVVTTRCPRVE